MILIPQIMSPTTRSWKRIGITTLLIVCTTTSGLKRSQTATRVAISPKTYFGLFKNSLQVMTSLLHQRTLGTFAPTAALNASKALVEARAIFCSGARVAGLRFLSRKSGVSTLFIFGVPVVVTSSQVAPVDRLWLRSTDKNHQRSFLQPSSIQSQVRLEECHRSLLKQTPW